MQIPQRTNQELEQLAEKFLQDHAIYDHRTLMIEQMIERIGYQIVPVPGLSNHAEAFVPIRGNRIFVDEDQYQLGSPRFRFTLAEELAHIILHKPLFEGMRFEEVEKARDDISDEQYEQIEREAKFFAGNLLMPKTVLSERFRHHNGTFSQRPMSDLQRLRKTVFQLNMDFNASSHAVAVRLRQLGLMDAQEYSDLMELYDSNRSSIDTYC